MSREIKVSVWRAGDVWLLLGRQVRSWLLTRALVICPTPRLFSTKRLPFTHHIPGIL